MLLVVDARAVGELQSLAERDEGLAREATRLRGLDRAITEIRARAEAITAFFAEHEQHEARLRDAERAAEAELKRRKAELVEASAELETARSDVEDERLRRRVDRANDHVAVAERAIQEAHAASRSLDRKTDEFARELPALEARAGRLSQDVPDAEEPAPGGLVEWASQAHALLFVALGQVDAQRERVIREANELATARLGEPMYGSTPAQALARVRAASAK